LRKREVPVDEAVQHCPKAVARVEADPSVPHRHFARDDGRNLLHPNHERQVARMKLVPTESEEKMGTTETEDHEGAGGDKYGGEAWHAVFLLGPNV